jgi:protein ImuA
VRAKIAAIEAGAAPARAVLAFGDARIDDALPGGGLPLGRWHEAVGEGLEIETAAAAGAFVAALTAPLAARGAVVWVMRRDDLYAPGLASLGFPAQRLIQVKARDEAQALAALEDALGTAGVVAAIGEAEGVDLTGGRRLQLACERGGATGFIIRRRPFGGTTAPAASGSAAATRWKIAGAPSEPAPGEPGLGAPRWRVTLERCRGGRGGAWIMEKSDGPYPLRVVALLGDRQLETPQPIRLAG